MPSGALEAVCSDRRCIVSADQCDCDVVDLCNPLCLLLTAQ